MNTSPTRFRKFSGLIILLICAIPVAIWWGSRYLSSPPGSVGQTPVEESHSLDPPGNNASRTISLPASGYVGSMACAECHAEIAESYRLHPMANSMWNVSEAPVIEDYQDKKSFSPDGQHIYSVEKTDHRIYHREQFVSADGEELFNQAEKIDYAVGSGAQGRSYITQHDELLLMSPISWYTGSQKWDLSPGYRLPEHKRFSRRVTEACLDCHAGRLNSPRGQDDHFGSPPFHELSIGCERCHGPAEAHVAHHRNAGKNSHPDPIVNPAKLDSLRRDDICSQCHLQGEGRIPRSGHKVGDYRPGQRLDETCLIIVKQNQLSSEDAPSAVSHVEQMRSSACYQNSQGQMSCTSCHDPHSVPSEAEKVDYYRRRCLKCHQEPHCGLAESVRVAKQPDDSCIACHMSSIGMSDVPHAANSDHRILRHPAQSPTESFAASKTPTIYRQDETSLEQHVRNRALGIWMAQRGFASLDYHLASRSVVLLTPVVRLMPYDADVQEALGLASSILQRTGPAITYFRKTLELEPQRELALLLLATNLERSGNSDEALPFLKQYLQLNPADAASWHRYSIILDKAGKTQSAITTAKKAVDLDPSKPVYYQWISFLLQKNGETAKAKQYTNRAASIINALAPPTDTRQ